MHEICSNFNEKKIIAILQLIVQKIDNETFKQYVLDLVRNSFVISRECSNFGMYVDFELIDKDKNNRISIPEDIPILFSVDLNTGDINTYLCCILYLSEDRKKLNFLEISSIHDNFHDLWNSFAV